MSITVNPNRGRRPTLIVTRGLPASGKSTAAVIWVNADPDWRVRINRDDLRAMGHGGYRGARSQEAIVSGIQHNGVRAALAHGTDVIVDDTNLPEALVRMFAEIAEQMDADFEIWDFRSVDVEVCVQRDALRGEFDRVGEDVIRDKHAKYIAAGPAAETLPARTRVLAKG